MDMKTLGLFLSTSLVFVVVGLGCSSSSSGTSGDVAFHGEDQPFPGFHYDTGLQPANSPVQVQFGFSADGKLTGDAHAISGGPDDAPVVAAKMGSGTFTLEGGFHLEGTLKVNLSGVPKYDGPIPGLKDVNVAFSGSGKFDPFLVGKNVSATADIPPTDLPPIPLPGGLPGTLNISIAAGSTMSSQFTGVCAAVTPGANAQAHYAGQTATSGTLKIKPTIVLKIPIVGNKTYDLPGFDVPVPAITRGLDLGTVAVKGGGSAPMGDAMKSGSCSPVSDEGGVSDAGTGSDGAMPDGSMGGDGGSGTCTAPQPIGNASLAWRAPYGPHLGVCTTQDITDYYGDCLGPNANAMTCSSLFGTQGPKATCGNCLTTDETNPSWGALVLTGTLGGWFNYPGCIALTDPAQLMCAKSVQALQRCEIAVCEPACSPNASSSEIDACLAAADQGVCATYVSPASCVNSLSPSDMNVCFGADQKTIFTSLGQIMCGYACNSNNDCPVSTTCKSGFCR